MLTLNFVCVEQVPCVKGSQLDVFWSKVISVYCYLEFNFVTLKTWNCFNLEQKNYLGIIFLHKKEVMRFCSFWKHFLKKPIFE